MIVGKKPCFKLTILILEKLTSPSSVKFGVPSSINAKSVRYMPRYGTHGGLQLWVINNNDNKNIVYTILEKSKFIKK